MYDFQKIIISPYNSNTVDAFFNTGTTLKYILLYFLNLLKPRIRNEYIFLS